MDTTTPPSPSLKEEEQQCCGGEGDSGSQVFQAIMMIVVTAVRAQAAYRAPWDLAFVLFGYAALGLLFLCIGMYDRLSTARSACSCPWDLAFVVIAYANLTALFVVLRRAKRLAQASPANKERRRLLHEAWELSAALSCAFAFRVERIMLPAAMAVTVWTMTACILVGGLHFLVLNDGRGSEDCHAPDDGQSSFNKLTAHEMA